ncbi:hypothetical protein JZO83_04255 [Enterococcus sp. DIV1298c]|uniref:hypothetical protein n=1 Tax=Enterococcus sp. DIV1298c TaxID=2815328 RepID=UPI001A92CFE1|nr:hypothetical protein [Enterococcus sp. DIV1298c]MBO0460953.1 hypothetical protein [Enterococcus sp. DIV1298c]
MKENRIRTIGGLGLALILFMGASLFLWFQNVNLKAQVKDYQSETQLLKQSENNLKQNIEVLTDDYDKLYKEKNGTANEELILAANVLFASIYNYDTSRPDGNIIVRKDKAKEAATDKVVDSMFPKDSSETVTTVDTVSRLTKDPEVYLMSSDSRQLQALVVVDYEVSIAESSELTGHYMYRITYNNHMEKIDSIQNVGEFE